MAPPPVVSSSPAYSLLWLTAQTPSPHRFITSKPANPTAKPSSSLRFQQGAPKAASSQQFVPAPKFSVGSTQKSVIVNAATATQHASPLSGQLRLPGAILNKHWEEIEEKASNVEETEEGDEDGLKSALSTEPISKRRRPNPPEAVIISSDSPSPSPPPTTPPYPTVEEDDLEAVAYNDANPPARPRFVLPTPKPNGTPLIPSRPPLILPPRSPSPPIATPAFFSPHRRGQKYVHGGLASTVRDWIVETSQQAHNRAHARRDGDEVWNRRFRVKEYRLGDSNERTIIVQGRTEARRWMLVGMGRGDTKVEVDCIVGIREPTWEVLIENEYYMVAIEWKVLNG